MKMARVLGLAGKSAVRGLPIAIGADVGNPVAGLSLAAWAAPRSARRRPRVGTATGEIEVSPTGPRRRRRELAALRSIPPNLIAENRPGDNPAQDHRAAQDHKQRSRRCEQSLHVRPTRGPSGGCACYASASATVRARIHRSAADFAESGKPRPLEWIVTDACSDERPRGGTQASNASIYGMLRAQLIDRQGQFIAAASASRTWVPPANELAYSWPDSVR